ncbi:MAG TPA: hypothetical protein VFX80_12160 [Solirubrobacteraceae bacterium]|nr:hypothetical protein [Solirubrobacteraceae bacterium]
MRAPAGGHALSARNAASLPACVRPWVITAGIASIPLSRPISVRSKNASSTGRNAASGGDPCPPWNMKSFLKGEPSSALNSSTPSSCLTLKSCQPWAISAGTLKRPASLR